jgi:(p)ppGpp synthase/HD superfamily hydrolase
MSAIFKHSDRLMAARRFAIAAHYGQRRAGNGRPFVVHPAEVGRILLNYYPHDEELVIAGFLHDTVEDTSTTIEEVTRLFGERVAGLVFSVTDVEQGTWRKTRQLVLNRLENAEPDTLRLKIADGFSNSRSLLRECLIRGVDSRGRTSRATNPEDMYWYHGGICQVAERKIGEEPLVRQYRDLIELLWG